MASMNGDVWIAINLLRERVAKLEDESVAAATPEPASQAVCSVGGQRHGVPIVTKGVARCSLCGALWDGDSCEVGHEPAPDAPQGLASGYHDGDMCPNGCGPLREAYTSVFDCIACGERKFPHPSRRPATPVDAAGEALDAMRSAIDGGGPYDDATIERLLADADECRRIGITPNAFERIIATLRETVALRAMLDRIAAIDGVEFDPRQEECIADGVDSLSAERDEWEAAHDRAVEDNRTLRTRADLLERAAAVAMAERDEAKETARMAQRENVGEFAVLGATISRQSERSQQLERDLAASRAECERLYEENLMLAARLDDRVTGEDEPVTPATDTTPTGTAKGSE